MNAYFKRLNLIIITLILILIPGVLFQFLNYNNAIQEKIQETINLELVITSHVLEDTIASNIQTLNGIEDIILSTTSDNVRLQYLEHQLQDNPSYLSLYFGTPDNHMINGSGWIPSPDFDLRERPWYIKAVDKGSFITTNIYRNASNDHYIVTFAKPVYDNKKRLLGVIGGDNDFDEILSQLRMQTISENGVVFFMDDLGELIMHSSHGEDSPSEQTSINMFTNYFTDMSTSDSGFKFIKHNSISGYLAWNRIESTGWIIGNFSPYNDFVAIQNNFRIVLIALFISLIAIIILIIILQKKHLIGPLLMLDNEIQHIEINNNLHYRLKIEAKDPFIDTRLAINRLLSNTQSYFERLAVINEELAISQEENKAIIDVLPDMIFVYNRDGVFTDYLTASTKELILSKEEFIGKSVYDVMPKDIADLAIDKLEELYRTNELQLFEYSLETPIGIEHFECRLQKINEGEAISIVRNITDRLNNLERIQILSYHDQLTGLYNRRFFEEEMIRLDISRNSPLTLAIFDVNGLKLTNDAFGHLAGDELLVTVANTMTQECRGDEIVARIGGDEFVILLPNTDEDEASAIVNRIQNSMSEIFIKDIPLSVSAGWASKISEDQNLTDIFIMAENRMYKKKVIESQSMRNQAIQSILYSLNHKSPMEKNHSESVSALSRQIGVLLGFRYEELKELETAALVHDVGKIALGDQLLSKPGPLTQLEYEEVKRHPEIGYQILKLVDTYSSIAEYVLHHHERWDGTGYPQGLAGSEIPLISRIICICDAYEAMTSDRPFRDRLSYEHAKQELIDNAGKQFDPQLVSLFIDLLEELDHKKDNSI